MHGMPKFRKSAPETVLRFEAALPRTAEVEPRQMFGYRAAFVNGNFFTGLFEDDVVMRLPGGIKERLPALAEAAGFNPMGGKPMRDWWLVPAPLSTDERRLTELLATAFEEVRRLPAKAAKKKPAAAPPRKQRGG